MTTITRYLILGLSMLLTACGSGTSGENGPDPFNGGGNGGGTTDPVYTLSVATYASDCGGEPVNSADAGDSLCVIANLSVDGNAAEGLIVEFSADLGQLSSTTKLTDANGNAQVRLDSTAADVGAAALTATYEALSATSNYEFLRVEPVTEPSPALTLMMLADGVAVNRFAANTEVVLSATLLDADAAPMQDQIITFSAGLGSLSPASALTDAAGVAQVTLTASDDELGAAIATASLTVDGVPITNSLNYQIQASGQVNDDSLSVGHFDDAGSFVADVMGASNANAGDDIVIQSGGTFGVSVALVDSNGQRALNPFPVTFSSNCVSNGLASMDSTVTTINGEATTTYTDLGCGGAQGNTDQIVASLNINNTQITLTRSVLIEPESVGSIEFVSAAPQQIVLAGGGGVNSPSSSILTFLVRGATGNPLSQQTVNFSLNTQAGGLSLSSASGLTNSAGEVSTRVQAGNVPTAVRVTATATGADGNQIQTQSELLSVSTGLPDQNSFSLAAAELNPEAFNINGKTVRITAWLADSFNNPVPDGTTVNFTTEGGSIQPSCNTTNGSCSVNWTSADPRTDDHRITILATAIGHETLLDANGNNVYDDGDGVGFNDGNDNGLAISAASQTGFIDYSEAWRDDDEDGIKDANEIFIDHNNDGSFSGRDSLFNGPQCQGSSCGTGNAASTDVRRALVMVMASSVVLLDVYSGNDIIASNHQATNGSSADIPRGNSREYRLEFSDTAMQAIPLGSNVQISTTNGLLGGTTSFTMPNSTAAGARVMAFSLTNDIAAGEPASSASVTATVTTPSGVQSSTSFIVNLN